MQQANALYAADRYRMAGCCCFGEQDAINVGFAGKGVADLPLVDA